MYSRVCECGEMMNGASQFQRSGTPPFSSCGWMPIRSPVRLS